MNIVINTGTGKDCLKKRSACTANGAVTQLVLPIALGVRSTGISLRYALAGVGVYWELVARALT